MSLVTPLLLAYAPKCEATSKIYYLAVEPLSFVTPAERLGLDETKFFRSAGETIQLHSVIRVLLAP